MMIGPRRKQFYAVSASGVGLLSGTLARSRREAIRLFQLACPAGSFALDWNKAKHAGYRTVRAVVEIRGRFGTHRTTRRWR